MSEPMVPRLGFSKMIGVGAGGDGGFLVISPNGTVHKVGPWDPMVVKAVTAALQAHPQALQTLQEFGLIPARA